MMNPLMEKEAALTYWRLRMIMWYLRSVWMGAYAWFK